ncbi:NAD/NADP octopine/nopaline dehydrogenase family protein [Microbacterium sp. NPDC055910]|uniref:NAD/NADP-dependent octopine/nopaline dehydrogenase family protein n=1 Tax=Microbacterium sp. NPDC055910 TaxID=3345659 RepID=UPI0035DC15F6
MNKRVAVLGGGNGAHMMAADMKLRGHEVRMFEMPEFAGRLEQLFATRTVKVTSVLNEDVLLDVVTSDIDEAVSGADYILVVTPAFAHAAYAQLLKGRVNRDQILVSFPGAFAALEFRKALEGEDCPVIADANNLPYDVRLSGPASVALHGYNDINIAFLPASKGPELFDQVREDLFPFTRLYDDVLECGLSIVNPTVHTGPCLLNVSHIESPSREFFLYEHGVTPSSMKVNVQLDRERKSLGAALGYHLRPVEDFSGLQEDYTWQDLYKALHGEIALTPISGPNSIHNRYLTEDAPYGLVPWVAIAGVFGVDMPLTTSILAVYNVIHETDWFADGLGLEELGLDGMDAAAIRRYVTTCER